MGILEELLASPGFRTLVEGIALKVFADLLHRRSVDPEFLKNSDQTFAQLATAKTQEEAANAQNALLALMSSG